MQFNNATRDFLAFTQSKNKALETTIKREWLLKGIEFFRTKHISSTEDLLSQELYNIRIVFKREKLNHISLKQVKELNSQISSTLTEPIVFSKDWFVNSNEGKVVDYV